MTNFKNRRKFLLPFFKNGWRKMWSCGLNFENGEFRLSFNKVTDEWDFLSKTDRGIFRSFQRQIGEYEFDRMKKMIDVTKSAKLAEKSN